MCPFQGDVLSQMPVDFAVHIARVIRGVLHQIRNFLILGTA